MPASDILSRLANLIGDAAVDPKAWPAAVEGLTDALHANQSVLSIQDTKANAVSVQAPRIDPVWVRAYAEHWAERNFLWQRGHSEPAGRLLRYEDFLPRDEFNRTEFYNEFRCHLRQPLATVQQPLHRLRLELPREAPSGSPLCHPSLLRCLGSLANPPAPGGKSR